MAIVAMSATGITSYIIFIATPIKRSPGYPAIVPVMAPPALASMEPGPRLKGLPVQAVRNATIASGMAQMVVTVSCYLWLLRVLMSVLERL